MRCNLLNKILETCKQKKMGEVGSPIFKYLHFGANENKIDLTDFCWGKKRSNRLFVKSKIE